MAPLPLASNPSELRSRISRWRDSNEFTALVPTMGALHDGHLMLVKEALRRADRVVVSIFLNPRQFAAGEDLETYPRDLSTDLARLAEAGAHLAYVPDEQSMYPDGFATSVTMAGPATAGLEDRFRPHFFDGVAIVVAKLFIQAGCDYAIFGEKDYQQLKVVTRMAIDLDIPVTVIGMPTVRESDGLALSSRNVYLSEQERQLAPRLHAELQRCVEEIAAGRDPNKVCSNARRRLIRAGFKPDYLTARNANSLQHPQTDSEPLRLLVAAWLGKTRLIDNIAV